MKNACWLALTLAVVLGYTAAQVQARGGHGGGHHGGGHHGGGHHGGHHNGHHGGHHTAQHHHHNGHHQAHYNGHHPFSPGWYGNHNGAWGNGVGYNNLWAPATYGGAAAWLGMSAANPYAYSYPQTATVYTSDNGSSNGPANQIADNAPTTMPNYVAQATQLAGIGAANTPKDANFMPLGVFSLAPENEKDAHAMVQLAVSKEGVVRGTYYDLEDDEALPVQGAVDKKTQRVAFTLGDDSKDVFETALSHLTDATGPLAIHSQDGKTTRWTLARFDKAPAETEEKSTDESAKTSQIETKPLNSST
jgi:hypothetical protein